MIRKNTIKVNLTGQTLGKTHGAHETRHLARKMNKMREIPKDEWNAHEKERSLYATKLCQEIFDMTEKVKMLTVELNEQTLEIPAMPTYNSLEEARDFSYDFVEKLQPNDFIVVSKLAMSYEIGISMDISKEEIRKTRDLILQCIELLNVALAELVVEV